MAVADQGGFDILIEASPTLASQLFSAGPVIQAPDRPFGNLLASGTARIRLTRRSAAFASSNAITLSFGLTGSTLDITTAPGFPTVPQGLRTVDINGSVSVVDRIDGAGLAVLVDTTQDAAAGTPAVAVSLENASILASPLVSILLAQAFITGGETAMTAARNALLQTVETTLRDGITAELNARPVQQGLFTAPARFLPTAAPLNPPATVPPVAVSSSRTLRVGIQLGGAPGNLSMVTRSSIRPSITGGDIDGLALVISNASLLRDFLRPTVGNLFGLTAGGFLANDPFRWFGSVTTTLPGTSPMTVTSVSVFVNEIQQLVLLFSFSASGAGGGITVSATVSIPISIGVMAAGGSITVTFTPGRPMVLTSRVDIAWWVYLLTAATLGFGGLYLLTWADAIADGAIGGPMETAIAGGLTAITATIPLPAGVPPVSVTMQSLFQGDAPRRMITAPGVPFTIPAPGRDHDLIVTFAA
jgi:ABC-type transporter Mla MlaB component